VSGLIDAALDEDGSLTASTTLPGERDVEVLAEPGEQKLSLEQLTEIVEDALRPLDRGTFSEAEREILAALDGGATTEAPTLRLDGVIVEPGGVVVLLYTAQSPAGESTVYCTLGPDQSVESIEVADEDIPTVEFDSLDDLLDHLSAAPGAEPDAPAEGGTPAKG